MSLTKIWFLWAKLSKTLWPIFLEGLEVSKANENKQNNVLNQIEKLNLKLFIIQGNEIN